MAHNLLSDSVEATAGRFGIPGVAVGVWAHGEDAYACHGVTSLENPLPIDRDTLYVLGSVTKTFTAPRRGGGMFPNCGLLVGAPRLRSPCCICSTTPRSS